MVDQVDVDAAARAWALEVDVAVARAAWAFIPPMMRDHPNATRMHARHVDRLHELLREVGTIARKHATPAVPAADGPDIVDLLGPKRS
ncbi:MAG TPA: hypothetical protein VGJ25_16300 [Gaiellaceae bacterium]|jgi:hypothetical protein